MVAEATPRRRRRRAGVTVTGTQLTRSESGPGLTQCSGRLSGSESEAESNSTDHPQAQALCHRTAFKFLAFVVAGPEAAPGAQCHESRRPIRARNDVPLVTCRTDITMAASRIPRVSAGEISSIPPENLLFAVPKKGRLHEKCMKMLEGVGLEHRRPERLDLAHCINMPVRAKPARKFI